MSDEFAPHRRLTNGHAMTLWAWARRRQFPRLPAPDSRIFQVAPDARVLAHCHWQRDRQSRPTILALHGLEGLKHMASSIVPGIYHEQQLDGKIPVSTEDAYSVVYRLSQEEGILVGQSSGAAMFAAIKLARTLRKATIVTIFPDFGDKYLTTNLWVGWRDRMSVGNLQFSI